MNILDLKKGDKVYGGVERSGQGCAITKGYRCSLEVRNISLLNGNMLGWDTVDLNIRLSDGGDVIYATRLFDGCVYATEEDFLDGKEIARCNISRLEISNKLATTCGLRLSEDGYPEAWIWDGTKKEAKLKRWVKDFNLADPKLPDGYYATKGECEKANRKAIKVAIHRKDTHIIEVDADTFEEALNWVDEHIDEIVDNADEMDYMVEEVVD